MKRLIIWGGFYLPALVLAWRAQILTDYLQSIVGVLLGALLCYLLTHRETPWVRNLLERF
ncbi:hypothetical protein [Sulfuricurvum sp.]|uniref:hypothetical protein n=1 Tax=Sulfuricurvum sp. TaxID=2025608 RepID=UPI002603E80D|nr:hypothetical protein [Sulfuricurvum sp.]MDD2781446.1 hypothetical protein [Sulfuricurvum sp.]